MELLSKRVYLLPVFLLLIFFACKSSRQEYTSPAGYDFEKPEKFLMPENLLEISGIAFSQGKNDTIYSIQDEDGRLFRQGWGDKKDKHTTFGKKGDYEDLAILKETVIILNSNGNLITFPLAQAVSEKVRDSKITKDLLPAGEYESLFADEQTGQVYLICKNCKDDKKHNRLSGTIFTFDQAKQNFIPSGRINMDLTGLISSGQVLKTGLKASALARDQHTGDWYILSSVNKLLVIAGPDWKIKSTHRLNSSDFNQPEGIAFDQDRNLYISNEGDELSSGNILKFKRGS